MEQKRKDRIFQKLVRSNLPKLCENTDCNSSFLDIFIQKNVISVYEKDVILGKGPKYDKSSEFYAKILQKGPFAYKILVNALRLTNQDYAANVLLENGGILKDDILKLEQDDKVLNTQYGGGFTQADAMDLTQNYNMEQTVNSFNQLNVTSPLLVNPVQNIPNVLQSNLLPQTGVLPLNPQLSLFATPTVSPEIADFFQPYGLKSSPKGYALIINIVSFGHADNWLRKGASEDSESLSKLFQELGFLVYAVENLTFQLFHQVLDEFKERFKIAPVDSSIVCVMSHGDEGDNVYTSDRAIINVKRDILEKFNNRNCPQLKGKPKLFFFQFCRGDTTDYGTTVADSPSPFGRNATSTTETTIPTWTDMLVCYSSLEGHYAYRHTESGSWFIQILCNTFREFGHQLDVCELLNLVALRMKMVCGDFGEKQICPYTNIGFVKKFYFNKDT